ncbi:S9 family peptidase [Winogradskyella echinorum]|uniref:S9 family peptidase n=1 Tax=Winogradskyella echinorum TaxID=538189 RepID=A0ABR6Y1S1_9FLAO|nr:S9 family peptidase [Winogradskyella echinorum]MBC3846604.1 S9 family peptidase [Winogradskyella echinorum]MBC5750952.1 S9 family peptidase [Winogradskyella echinorum]
MIKNPDIIPPVAKKIPHQIEKHGDVRVDNYFWMKDREHPEVIGYLNSENEYCDAKMAHTKDLQKDLFEEMKARIKEDDSSVPYKYNGYWYITKFEKGKDYPIYTRKKDTLDNPEELLFDCNEMAEGESFFKLAGISISPDNKLVSYGIDTTGRRNYTIHVKNLETNEVALDRVLNTTGSSSWANDNETLFYTKKDAITLRAFQIYKHRLGDNSEDELVFQEGDDTFGVAVYKSKSRKYIIIACYSTLTNEYHILDADNPEGKFKVFQPRIRGLEYSISHYDNHFYILTNKDKSTNFKLMKTLETDTKVENWKGVIAHRKDVLIEGIDIFKDYLVISERSNGLNQIRIKRWDETQDYYLPFDNETYTAYTGTNVDFDTEVLRYGYNSMTTPSSVIEFNMRTKTKTVLKEQEVLGGKFNKDNYTSERIWATAEDGIQIPMSVVYKKGIKKDGTNPLLQYAYGSYGSTVDPYFSTIRLSLLDRGFIYVIAHIRGGEYLGRQWYEDGKLLNKKNTFSDFIACSVHLIKERYTSSMHLYAMGGSAGGLLMGAIINKAPELYNGIIAAVPFVDVITTMLDDSIPLTTGEYDEWGNPNDILYYNYIKSYSPYDNIEAKDYPNMLVTTGLNDSQVQYWEPAKWVAKLREMKTDTNQLYLKTNMDAGHGGASGRFESLKEDAEEYAFLLDLEGISS